MNHTAAFVWAELRGGTPTREAASRLADAFGIAEDVAQRDIGAVTEEWGRLFGVGFDCAIGGKHFRLLLDSKELEDEILPRVAHLGVRRDAADFTLRRGTEDSVSAARALLLQEMVRLARGGQEWLALIHAGACASEAGCVVFAGPSGAGKTTLAAVLMQSGLRCHADDSVGIEKETLLIPAMPFAMAIREGSWGIVGRGRAGFEELPVKVRFGQRVRFLEPGEQSGATPALALVFPRFEAGAETRIAELEPLDRFMALKEAGFWVEHVRESIQAFVDWVVGLPGYRVVYSDVDEAAGFIGELARGVAGKSI